jgi:hypothetical protein
MRRTMEYRAALVLAAAVAGASLVSAGAPRVRVAGSDHAAHQWDGYEAGAYRRYLAGRHPGYRDYNSPGAQDQHNYRREPQPA